MDLKFYEYGVENEKTIVFLHALGVGSFMWNKQIAYFKDRFHIIIPDFPGHGINNNLEWNTLEDTAQRILTIIQERVKGRKVHIIGESLGGGVALTMLLIDPSLIDSAVISGQSLERISGTIIMKTAALLMRPFLKTRFLLRGLAKASKIDTGDIEGFISSIMKVKSSAFIKAFHNALDIDLIQKISLIENKVLLIAGEKEPKKMILSHCKAKHLNINFENVLYPGMGHEWMTTNQDAFNKVIYYWLENRTVPEEFRVNKKTLLNT
jgi:pimeloyl-ACP methyl ester carboxylesterase